MQKIVLLFCLILLGVAGCDAQRGKFVTTSGNSNEFSFPVGSIDIISGYEKKPTKDGGDLNEQNLLYVVILTPATNAHSSTSQNDYGKYVTTLTHSWNTEKGSFAVSIPWNRETDVVTIGKKEFVREQGNVFVVRLDTDGKISTRQLSSLRAHVHFQKVLEYVQQQLLDDKLISSVKLYE